MYSPFTKYLTIGIINTAIHWGVFFASLHLFHTSQAIANFVAFCIAVTFSFFANAHFTFKIRGTPLRYLLYIIFMGGLSTSIGRLADLFNIHEIYTLIIFSSVSLVCGFLYSKYIVFRSVQQ